MGRTCLLESPENQGTTCMIQIHQTASNSIQQLFIEFYNIMTGGRQLLRNSKNEMSSNSFC
jgi:hypothetical protein